MPRSTPTRPALDRQSVIQAAACLVNAQGAGALTIKRLARELGIQPPSLYNHVSGLPDIQRELAFLNASALVERLSQAAIGKSGPAGIRALASAYRLYILENSGLYQASLRASLNMDSPDPRLQAAEDQAVRVVLAIIDSFGLAGEEAVHAVRALRSLVHGFTSLEAAGGFGMPLSLDESFARLVEMFIRGLERSPERT